MSILINGQPPCLLLLPMLQVNCEDDGMEDALRQAEMLDLRTRGLPAQLCKQGSGNLGL